VNEVKEMFDRDETPPQQPTNQQPFGKRGGASRPGTTQGETMIEEEGKTAWNRKRPTSANIMVSELKYKIETKNRSAALPRAVSRDGTTVRRPGQPPQQQNISSSPPPPTEEEIIWAELKDADELFINSKPYRSHPLHQFRQQNDRAKAEKIRDELRQKEEAATTAAADRERSSSPPITRQLTSPRTTTIMLLSHDIVTKNEQQQQPQSRAQSSQYPRGPLSPSQNPFLSIQNFDVPVNIISNNPADGLTKEAFEKQVFQQQKNHRRMIHIVENEILHQNEMKATTTATTKTTTMKTITATIPSALIPTENSTENNINNTFSVPPDLSEQMKKQLTHYHIMQQQQQQSKDGRPVSASAPSPTQQQLINQYQRQFLSPDEDPASYSNQTSPRPLTREDAPVVLLSQQQLSPRGTTPRGEEAIDGSSSLDYTDGTTALPKIQWKAFMNSPPPMSAVVPLLDVSNLEASQEMMSNEPQQQISAPFIVINGKHFKNINRVSLEAPPHPIHMNDAENPTMKVNSNTASHNQLPQHPNQYKHNLQYFIRKAPLIEPSQKPVIINSGHHLHQSDHNNTTHTSNPPQFMIMNNHQLNKIQRANHQNNNQHNAVSAPSTDEVDHDFMNIADDIYLNDHLYFAHKYHNVQGGGGKEAEQDSAFVFNIQQVATAFDRQQDTVQINKNIVSDRIDRKHLQGFRFPSPKHQPQQQQQPPLTAPWNAENAYFNDTLPTIDDNHNYNQQHHQQRAVSSQGRSKSATGTTKKKKSKELKIDSNKMVLTPKTPTIRPVPIIPKSKSGKFETGDPQLQLQQPKTASVFSMNNLSVANETSLIAIEVPSSPSGNGNNLLSTPFLKPAPPDGFNSLMVNRSASVETAGRGEDLLPIGIHVNVHHTAVASEQQQQQPQPQPPNSSRAAPQPVAPAMAVVSRPQSAANTSRSNSRPSSAAIGRKLVSFNK
jgi:hypothetical protein